MLQDAAIRAAMKRGISTTLSDDGRRGDGRLVVMIRGDLVEFYARQIQSGRRRLVKLGNYPQLTLADARDKFRELSAAIRDGLHIRTARDAQRELATLWEMCAAYVESLAGRRAQRIARHNLLDGTDCACAAIGRDRPAASITPDAISAWLRPIHRRSPSSAASARAYLAAAFSWAMRCEFDYTINQPHRFGVQSNPVAAVPADPCAFNSGNRALTADEFRGVWDWCDSLEYRVGSALRLLMATGQRVEEIVGLQADQLRDGWLHWPTTKTGTAHAIPLPRQALAVFETLRPNRHGLFFPDRVHAERPEGHALLSRIVKRCGVCAKFTPRDLRRTWRTLAGDVGGLNAEECARIMNHAYGSAVERTNYNKGQDAVIKTAAMVKWSDALDWLISGQKKPGSGPG